MKTARYEIVYILNKNVSDTVHIEQQLTELLGGKIEKIEKLGEKELSYPIAKESHGIYFLIQAVVKKTQIIEFQKKIRRMKDILRCLVINLENEKHFNYPKPKPFKTMPKSTVNFAKTKTKNSTNLKNIPNKSVDLKK